MNFEPRISLHNHTSRCKHAGGAIEEYCREAVAQNISVLGFSDHNPFPDGFADSTRMKFNHLPDYLDDIRRMREEFPDLTILAGLEVDYFPSRGDSFYEDTYANYRFDYLLGAVHWTENDTQGTTEETCRLYVDAMIKAIKSKMFSCIVHPDMVTHRCSEWNQELKAIFTDLIVAAREYKIPLEINAYGLRKPWFDTPHGRRPQYPWRPFWELVAELGAPVVVGADAHRPHDVWGNTDDAIRFALEAGLTPINRSMAEKISCKSP